MPATESERESTSRASARWSWPLSFAGFLVCLVPIFYVGGFRDSFTYWNCLPVAIAFIVLLVSRQSTPARAFALVSAGITVFMHLAWIGDWGGITTGSSTSGLIFIFIPAWSVAFGIVASFIARLGGF